MVSSYFDGTKKWQRTFVHTIMPALLSVAYLWNSILNVYLFNVNTWDYGIFSTLLWNFSHGNGWYVPFYEGSVYSNFLADHFTLMPILLSPIFYIFPHYITLSIIQCCAISAVFFLAPIFVREIYRSLLIHDYEFSALFLTVLLSCFRGVTSAASYQAHMTTLILPFIFAALIALHRKSFVLAAFFCIIVSFGQERSIVAVCSIGMYAFLVLHQYVFGFSLCAAASLYFLTVYKWIIPYFAQGSYKYSSSLNPFWGIGLKLHFLFKFLAGWAFLPIIGKKALLATLCAFPILGIGLVSDRLPMLSFLHHYQDMPSVFFFAGATYGCAWLMKSSFFAKIPRKLVVLGCLLVIVGTAHASRASIPFARIFYKVPNYISSINVTLAGYYAIDDSVSVYAQSGLASRFSMRKKIFHLSLKKSQEPLVESVVVFSPKLDAYPEIDIESLRKNLDSNSTLKIAKQTDDVIIYITNDLSNEQVQRVQD